MADGEAPATEGGGGTFGFLTRKIGPLPVWAWAAIGFGAYYWYTHYGPGASSSSGSPKAAGASTIIVTGGDAGGDSGDGNGRRPKPPKTGGGGGGQWKTITVPAAWNGWTLAQIGQYLHWTPETLQDVQEANARGGQEITASTKFRTGDTFIRPIGPDAKDSSSSPEMTASDAQHQGATANPGVAASGNRDVTGRPAAAGVAGTYRLPPQQNRTGTTTGWEAQAINYLIGEGVPPDQASTSVWSYLQSEPLSSRMQANVNLATDGIGPPPNVPGPATVVRRVPPRNTPRKVAA